VPAVEYYFVLPKMKSCGEGHRVTAHHLFRQAAESPFLDDVLGILALCNRKRPVVLPRSRKTTFMFALSLRPSSSKYGSGPTPFPIQVFCRRFSPCSSARKLPWSFHIAGNQASGPAQTHCRKPGRVKPSPFMSRPSWGRLRPDKPCSFPALFFGGCLGALS